MEQDYKKQIEEIIAGIKCQRDFMYGKLYGYKGDIPVEELKKVIKFSVSSPL